MRNVVSGWRRDRTADTIDAVGIGFNGTVSEVDPLVAHAVLVRAQ